MGSLLVVGIWKHNPQVGSGLDWAGLAVDFASGGGFRMHLTCFGSLASRFLLVFFWFIGGLVFPPAEDAGGGRAYSYRA